MLIAHNEQQKNVPNKKLYFRQNQINITIIEPNKTVRGGKKNLLW